MQEENDEEEIDSCTVILLGDSGVGKTSIIKQYVNESIPNYLRSSTCAEFSYKIIDLGQKRLNLQIWDTVGQERYRSINTRYYQKADACILVYDITNSASFDSLKTYWIEQVKQEAPPGIILGIAGNKSDLINDEKVDEKDSRDFAEKQGAFFASVSAVSNSGIANLFLEIVHRYPEFAKNKKENEKNKLKLKDEKDNGNKGKKKCC